AGPARPGGRDLGAEPALLLLRRGDRAGGRRDGADPDARGGRLRVAAGGGGGADRSAHQGDPHHYPGQPLGGDRHPGKSARDRGAGNRARPGGDQRRNLREVPLGRRRAPERRLAAGDGRADDHAQRLLEDLRDDRLAPRLRRRRAGPHAGDPRAQGERQRLRAAGGAVGRRRGARRAARLCAGVPHGTRRAPPRPDGRPHRLRLHLRPAPRRLLHLCQHRLDRPAGVRPGPPPPPGRAGADLPGHRLRRRVGRLPALLLPPAGRVAAGSGRPAEASGRRV
ncbi:MAG: Aspartate aminotransferase, partial [uncultured Thermomicrobiales bacterium]